MIYISRKEHFNAAHKLYNPNFNEEENFEKITLRLYSSSLPFPANYFVRARMRSNIQTHLKGFDIYLKEFFFLFFYLK